MHPAGTAILTGANGFIGSHLARVLLARGWTVHALGRGKAGAPWRKRVLAALAAAGATDGVSEADRLHCHEADLAQPGLGLQPASALPGDGQAVLVHLAGDTRFIPPDPIAQRQANVEGALNVVHGLRPRLCRAVHISTAYVSGDRTGTILESEGEMGQGFHNNYEQTKLEAEQAVHRLCRELRLPLAIARPSVIVNDTVNGRSSAFTHLNVLVEVANRIQEFYGIHDGEVVNRQIRFPVDPAARPNIAAVDPIAEAMACLVESPASAGRTFHLCHPAPQTNAEVFGLVMEAFGVKERIPLQFVPSLSRPLTRTEEMIARAFRVYLPYLNHGAVFDLANTRSLVPDYDRLFHPASVEYLRKVIAFERAERKS